MCQGVCLVFALIVLANSSFGKKYKLTVGYLPCIKGDMPHRQGLIISGAITMALDEINNSSTILPEVQLNLAWGDTRCDTGRALRLVTEMMASGVVAFFGPEGNCKAEALVTNSRNLPMLAYKCSDHEPSTLSTFARFEPLDIKITTSVISLLRYYRWNKFSIVYEEPYLNVAQNLEGHARRNNMTINHKLSTINAFRCCAEELACCRSGFWYQLIQRTKDTTRIYVFLGSTIDLVDLMDAMETHNLLTNGEYMVVFVDQTSHLPFGEALKDAMLMKGMSTPSSITPELIKRARSLLAVSSVPKLDTSYKAFSASVRQRNSMPPFDFQFPQILRDSFNQFVSIFAAYLYDSVKLYASALDAVIKEDVGNGDLSYSKLMDIATNGSHIVDKIVKAYSPYKSISGISIQLDENGDSNGHFSLFAFKQTNSSDFDMVPVAQFEQQQLEYPMYKMNPRMSIDWPADVKPEDEPSCGYLHNKCQEENSTYKRLLTLFSIYFTYNLNF